MCGIVGYIGNKNAEDIILNGLKKLEYRGYDSAGISIVKDDKIKTIKKKGNLDALIKATSNIDLNSNLGIGHTRWATHGEPNEVNAHPHLNNDNTISIVHNGIIENYIELRNLLKKENYNFLSQTDSEVVAHLLDKHYKGDMLEAISNMIKDIDGAYALAIISSKITDQLFAVRHESPLIVGVCDDGYILASDIPSVLEHTRKVIYLDNGEIVKMTKNSITIYDEDLNEINKEIKLVDWSMESASKSGFDHFLIKEIFEQPQSIKTAINVKLKDDKINLSSINFTKDEINSFDRIYISACGTAYHAGEVGKFALEKLIKRPVESIIASEFRYRDCFVTKNSLVIFVSQSGETADTLAALKKSKSIGAKTIAITNVVGSSISREADHVIYCHAGPEISVASTKAYTTQVIALYFLAMDFAVKLELLDDSKAREIISEIKTIPEKIQYLLNDLNPYKEIANEIKDEKSIFYTGRTLDYITAKEGALKLKEISYIHTEAFASGELKHGSIALIEEGTKVFSIITQADIVEKTISNNQELSARGAKVYSICFEGNQKVKDASFRTIFIPQTMDLLSPLITVIPEQLIAYFTSLYKGNDVDKPRNLAKSVTVE